MSTSVIYRIHSVNQEWIRENNPRNLIESAAQNIAMEIVYDSVFSKKTIAKFYFLGGNIEAEFSGKNLKMIVTVNNPECLVELNRLLAEIKQISGASQLDIASELRFGTSVEIPEIRQDSVPKKKKKKKKKHRWDDEKPQKSEQKIPDEQEEVVQSIPTKPKPWDRLSWVVNIFLRKKVG